jgi:hypothetical protein
MIVSLQIQIRLLCWDKEKKTMKRLWARMGMSVDVTDEEHAELVELLKEGKEDEAREIIVDMFLCNGYINGDSYMPGNWCDAGQDNPNENVFDLIGG